MMTALKVTRSPLVVSILVGLIVFLGVMGLRLTGSLESLELAAYDGYIRTRPKTSTTSDRVVLIRITERDLRSHGRWPVSDEILAKTLSILTSYGPRVIGLDIYRDIEVPPGREELDAVLADNPHIIAAMKFGDAKSDGVPPPPVLQNTDRVGFNDILVDPGGIVRRGLLFLDDNVTTVYSFSLRLALRYLQPTGVVPESDPANPQYLRLGSTTIPRFQANDGGYVGADAQGYQFLLDFRETRNTFASYSLTALLNGEIHPEVLKDKIVLIGVAAESVKDVFYTPHSRRLHADQQIQGIVLHAYMVNQLLRFALDNEAPIASPREWQEVLWILGWSIMGCVIGLWVRGPWRLAMWIAGGLLILRFVTYGAFWVGWWVPVVPSALTWMCSAAVVTAYMSNQEKRQRTLLMQLFARHVSQEVAENIWRQRDQFLYNGRPRAQRMIATVLFTDMIGFTSISEKMDPQVLTDWLNEYMEAMTPHVVDHQGVVLRFIGDAIMAVFGIPLARHREEEIGLDAVHAVQCALSMSETLVQLNNGWLERGLPMVGMRIGIFTGPVVAGSLGNTQRMEYNVHGDTVVTAARLESFEKDRFSPNYLSHPCRTLIGESTLRYLNDRFLTYEVGMVALKGKNLKVSAYEVIGCKNSRTDNILKEEQP